MNKSKYLSKKTKILLFSSLIPIVATATTIALFNYNTGGATQETNKVVNQQQSTTNTLPNVDDIRPKETPPQTSESQEQKTSENKTDIKTETTTNSKPVATNQNEDNSKITKSSQNTEQNHNINKIILPGNHSYTYVTVPKDIMQHTIDTNRSIVATDFDTTFNPGDGRYTWFSGHASGGFAPVANLQTGNIVSVTDHTGNLFNYKVVDKMYISCDAEGWTEDESAAMWVEAVKGGRYGESIVLQTCTHEFADGSFRIAVVVTKKI